MLTSFFNVRPEEGGFYSRMVVEDTMLDRLTGEAIWGVDCKLRFHLCSYL